MKTCVSWYFHALFPLNSLHVQQHTNMPWISWFSVFVHLIVLFLIQYVQDLHMEILLYNHIDKLYCKLNVIFVIYQNIKLNFKKKKRNDLTDFIWCKNVQVKSHAAECCTKPVHKYEK